MKVISTKYDFTRFHVIGGYDSSVIDIEGFEEKITFYGYRPFTDLAKIYSSMDIIVSPNQSNILGQGAFDGFPLGTLVEAALNGVLVMSCDPNQENIIDGGSQNYFQPDQEIIIIEPSVSEIVIKLEQLIQSNEMIKKIGTNGNEKFKEIYSDNFQMSKRLSVLKENIRFN
jgi:glycosyltransferase involved in cell wall biosynthesis